MHCWPRVNKATIEPIIKSCDKIIDLTGKSPEIIYSIAKISDLIISNDAGPGLAALSHSPILFLGRDNVVSKSNLSEYQNAHTILTDQCIYYLWRK